MVKILFNDGTIAVTQTSSSNYYEDMSVADEETVKLYLGLNESNFDSHIERVLDTGSFRIPIEVEHSESEIRQIISTVDKNALRELGLKVYDTHIRWAHLVNTDSSIVPISLRYARKAALRQADALQYIAKLYLLSRGCSTHLDCIGNHIKIDKNNHEITFTPTIPINFVGSVRYLRMANYIDFDSDSIAVTQDGRSFTVKASVIGSQNRVYGGIFACDGNEMAIQTSLFLAAALMSTLLNFESGTQYDLERNSLDLHRTADKNLYGILADCIIDKKITACPRCGQPVLKIRKNGNPFCKKSHQTRYSEDARKMFQRGASIEDVAAAFPHIKRATIENWTR